MPQTETEPAAAPRPGRISAHTAVIGLLAFLLVLVVLLTGFLVWREYQDLVSRAETRAANAAQTASEHVRWIVEASTQVLRRVEDALRDEPGAFTAGGVGNLADAVASLPHDTSLRVYNALGNSILATDPDTGSLNIADRSYFQAVQGGGDWYISPLLEHRASRRKIFTISHRLEHNGVFVGVAVVNVPVEIMSRFWATLDLGPASSIGLVRNDGWLVARHPIPQETLDLSEHVLFTEYLPRASKGFYHSPRSPADGVARVVGYHTVPGLPLIAIAGVSKDAAVGRLWARLAGLGLIGVPLLIAVAVISAWVAILLRREELIRDRLAAALEDNRLLLREVHHRVKNNLQVVASLVRLQPGTPEAKAEMARRIAAMSAVHEQLYRSDQLGRIDLDHYVRTLIDNLKETYGGRVSLHYELAPVDADIELALPLGLIVSEVTSNAFKHAFPDGREGTITVVLAPGESGRAQLRIADDGVGFDPAAADSGLGLRLLTAFTQQLNATYELKGDAGTTFTLDFSLTRFPEDAAKRVAAAA